MRANSFSMRVIDTWNLLPPNVVLAPSVDSFKSRLNKNWYGHPLELEASCYIPGVQRTIVTQEEMHRYRLQSGSSDGWHSGVICFGNLWGHFHEPIPCIFLGI